MSSKIEGPADAIIARDAPYYSAPPGLRERVRARLATEALRDRDPSRWQPYAMAASLLLVSFLSWHAALWRERSSADASALDEAVDAHVRSMVVPGRLTDVISSDQHTVKPWFNNKIDIAPPVSDFATAGFPLAGGRLDYLRGRPAAALIYRHNAHVVNVFISSQRDEGESPPVIGTRKGYAVARWKSGGLAFEAVGDISTTDMGALVELMRKSAS